MFNKFGRSFALIAVFFVIFTQEIAAVNQCEQCTACADYDVESYLESCGNPANWCYKTVFETTVTLNAINQIT